LIRLGPDVVLVDPANDNPAVAVAGDILARYHDVSPVPGTD